MLAQLRIQNFLSFRDEQTLELAASTDRTLLSSNTHPTQSRALPRLLRSLVLYGANGWGKTALIRAVRTARDLALGEEAALHPFALDNEHAHLPVSFSLDFFVPRVRCRCSFSLQTDARGKRQVRSEHLVTYTSRRPGTLCSRTCSPDGDSILIGPRLADRKHRLLQDLGADTLLCARCLQDPRLAEVRAWFARLHFVADEDLAAAPDSLCQVLREDAALRQHILRFLDACGTGICDLVFSNDAGNGAGNEPGAHVQTDPEAAGSTGNQAGQDVQGAQAAAPHAPDAEGTGDISSEAPCGPGTLWVRHHNQPGLLPWAALSGGTRKLIALLVHVIRTLDEGGILFLDNPQGLHPLVLRSLIRLFHTEADARGLPAQLVLTTHDTSLMQTVGSMLRRDQIWFVERTGDQTSELFSLASFSPRKQEAIERRYFQGMYGALPASTGA